MKSKCLFSSLILFTFFALAQGVNAQIDSKYLKGGVPEINGKVIFSDTLSIPGVSADEIYKRALSWAENNYNSDKRKVVLEDKEKMHIACIGNDELIFSSKAFSLDRAYMNYQLILFCEGNKCWYNLRSISYEYSVPNKKEPEEYIAEEWITDSNALNKNKDKLSRYSGKFRVKTIDLVDDIYDSLAITLNTGKVNKYNKEEQEKEVDRHTYSRKTSGQ